MGLFILLYLGYNFWTRNLSKLSKVPKVSDFNLVSNKNVSEILLSSSLSRGPDEVSQKGLKHPHLRYQS